MMTSPRKFLTLMPRRYSLNSHFFKILHVSDDDVVTECSAIYLAKNSSIVTDKMVLLFQPEDWDDEEDGEWTAPTIPNPEYKGEWKPKVCRILVQVMMCVVV
jgi:hypothetical protein